MKLVLLLLVIAFDFSFSNTPNQLFPRKLANNNYQYLLISFGNYHYDENDKHVCFSTHIKSLNGLDPQEVYISFNITFKNYSESLPIPCELLTHNNYSCEIENKTEIKQIQLQNKALKYGNVTIEENEILESSLVEKTKNNITEQTKNVISHNFNLTYQNLTKKNVNLKGNFNYYVDEGNYNESITANLTLNPSKNVINMTILIKDSTKRNEDEINFSLEDYVNDHLNGKMAIINEDNSQEEYVLIFAETNINDLILYSNRPNSFVELLQFSDYNFNDGRPIFKTNFRGTAINFKKYLKFSARVKSKNLRYLQDSTLYVNCTGELINTDTDAGTFQYNTTIYNLPNNSNSNIELTSLDDYEVSDDNNTFSKILVSTEKDIEYNMTNDKQLDYRSFKFNEKPSIVPNSYFSFDCSTFNTTNLDLINNSKVYIKYTPMDPTMKNETECSFENQTIFYRIKCAPKYDVYTFINTLKLIIPKLSTRNLRSLEEDGNMTIYPPAEAPGDIQYDYVEDVNSFGRKSTTKNGLSAGAIVAIVLATVAAVAAVGFAIFFLNRIPVPVSPNMKASTNYNFNNSGTNMNNQ